MVRQDLPNLRNAQQQKYEQKNIQRKTITEGQAPNSQFYYNKFQKGQVSAGTAKGVKPQFKGNISL